MLELEMSELYHNNLNIFDLSDEILFIILNKLNKIHVLNSLVYTHDRFYRLALDSLYIRNLDLTNMSNINSFYDQMSSINSQSLSRFSEEILPRIHHHVHKLAVEQDSIKQILTTNYPQLYSLSLMNFQHEVLHQYLTDDLVLRDLVKQITGLSVDMKSAIEDLSETVANTFVLILSLGEKLIDLNFGDMLHTRKCWTAVFRSSLLESCMSSTLVKLKINVVIFLDVLYLLDGRLQSLSTLIICVSDVYRAITVGYNGSNEKLPKLKCFSLTVLEVTDCFDSLIVPLLCRMINLQELQLYVFVKRYDSIFIDGIQLYDDFLIYLSQLSKFTFSIRTRVSNLSNEMTLQTNEDIQRSFIGRYNEQVASYVQTDLMNIKGQCHIYTVPYEFEYFYDLDNYFQRGVFRKVRYLTMRDVFHAFEDQFFQLISEEFPFLECLHVSNSYHMQVRQTLFTLITFPNLTLLDLKRAHVTYAELFLLKTNMRLPCLLNLAIDYPSLTMITNNFTNNARDFNFERLKSLDACQPFVGPMNFREYFPLL